MNTLTTNARKFLAKNPTFLTRRRGFIFYECPTHGDEACIKAITPAGKLVSTDSYELSDLNDWIDKRGSALRILNGLYAKEDLQDAHRQLDLETQNIR
jgi:hypothetical protein